MKNAALGFFGVMFIGINPSIADTYRISTGDVLQLSVLTNPDMKQRLPVNTDGQIVVPVLGPVQAAGLSIAEITASVRARLANQVVPSRSPDGRVTSSVLTPTEVIVEVAEYRPVYVRGDVAKAGEQTFRPGMTVRQAIAVAGGYSRSRGLAVVSDRDVAKLNAEVSAAWAELLSSDAKLWRLRTQAGQGAAAEKSFYQGSSLPTDAVEGAFGREAEQLQLEEQAFRRQATYLDVIVEQNSKRVDLLSRQQKNEEESSRQDAEDFERVAALLERGNTSAARYSESRRAMLLSATRILQTTAALAQVERDREEVKKSRDELDANRRAQIIRELQETETSFLSKKARLAGLRNELRSASDGSIGRPGGASVQLTVHRDFGSKVETLEADEGEKLQPGDVVEALVSDQPSTVTVQQRRSMLEQP